MSTSDKLLWEQLKSGNKTALEKIYQSEVEILYQYARRVTPDTNLIEDAIQELFIELWDRRKNLGSTDQIRPYLLTSIRRKVVYLLKKKGNISGEIEQELAFRSEEAIEKKIIQDETLSDQGKRLHEALDGLSKRQKEAIYLKFYNESSYEEVCEIMGINYQSARNLVASGLKRMKENLGDKIFLLYLLSTLAGLFT